MHVVDKDLDSTSNSFNISRFSLTPGVRFYSNVIAYTHSGLQTTVSSDGFIVDSDPPVSGIVYDGLGNKF